MKAAVLQLGRRPWTAACNAWFAEMPAGSVFGVTGVPGTGKSPTVQAAAAAGAFPKLTVYDPHNRLDRQRWGMKAKGAKQPWPGELLDPRELLARPALLRRPKFQIIVCPIDDVDAEEHAKWFAATARLVWAAQDVDLLGEEAALYARACEEVMNKLATGGGHVGMRLGAISQSITRFHIDQRRNFSHVLAYAQGEPVDVINLRKRCGKAFARRVQALQLGSPPERWRLGDALE